MVDRLSNERLETWATFDGEGIVDFGEIQAMVAEIREYRASFRVQVARVADALPINEDAERAITAALNKSPEGYVKRKLGKARIDELERELERWRHGQQIEGDYVCPNALEATNLRLQLSAAEAERDAYRAMLCDVLASAHPHPVEHPTMARQWARARELLKNGPAGAMGSEHEK